MTALKLLLAAALLVSCSDTPSDSAPVPETTGTTGVADEIGAPDTPAPDTPAPPPDTPITPDSDDTTAPPDIPDPPEERGKDIIDHAMWVPVPAEDDPFEDRPEDTAECPSGDGFRVFEDSFEIDTDFCLYMTASQPSLLAFEAGSLVQVAFWHLTLFPPEINVEAAEAHLAVRIADKVVWEKTVPIPSPDAFFDEQVPIDFDVEVGTPIYLHVHNHGPNSYRLLLLRVLPPKPIQ